MQLTNAIKIETENNKNVFYILEWSQKIFIYVIIYLYFL